MRTWQIPEWAISAALCGVLAMGAVDLYMMRRHPVKPHVRTQAETIGLHATQDGEALRIQWNAHARPVVNAERGVLYITDGGHQRQVVLSGEQLDGSSVRYWPESEHVSLRMEVYRGSIQTSESVDSALAKASHTKLAGRTEVEKLRPSPFEHVQPEIVVVQLRPPVVVVPRPAVEEQASDQHENSFNRVLSKIPLLRRLQRHQEQDENETPQVPR